MNKIQLSDFWTFQIGSESPQGAMGEFTQHTLRRMTRDEYERAISNSFLVSADMARMKIKPIK